MEKSTEQHPNKSQFCTHKKPRFLTKYRMRTSKNSDRDNFIQSSRNMQKIVRSKTETPCNLDQQIISTQKSCRLQNEMNQTWSKLEQINFSHHNPQSCVCAQCTCGRHLCQFHAIKPNLSKNTVYKKDFSQKKPIQNKINICKEYDRLMGPNLELNSVYLNDFDVKPAQIQRPKPKDSLKSQGPFMGVTRYSNQFPGHKGGNQYVKPTDSHVIDYFPIRSRSTYSRSFTGTPCKKASLNRVPDNLKTGSNWYGKTTYADTFLKPNPQITSVSFKAQQKADQVPKYRRMQTQTMYGRSFVKPQSEICPAKVIMQNRLKGYTINNKSKFKQNSDFKSMDPNFKSLSITKCGVN